MVGLTTMTTTTTTIAEETAAEASIPIVDTEVEAVVTVATTMVHPGPEVGVTAVGTATLTSQRASMKISFVMN